MRWGSPKRSARSVLTTDSLQLLVEASSWLAAWLILPVWLALRGGGAVDFLLYALGAGFLLAAGMAADRPQGVFDGEDVAWFAAVSCFAVIVGGGALFGIASTLR